MSMTTSVVGFRAPDETWDRMKVIYESCTAAGVTVPESVVDFFDGEPPRDRPGADVAITDAVTSFNDDYRAGFTVDITKLPKDLRYVRFYNSW